jgi:hypothetical protein
VTPTPPSGAGPERPPNYFSLDQQRVRLVADVVRQHSPLGEQDALDLAAHVLHTVDHLPETLRHARPPSGARA